MVFIACGLNHKTAPLALREQVALPVDLKEEWLQSLSLCPGVHEAAILSTCNRTEMYCETENPDALLPWFVKQSSLPIEILAPHFYSFQGHEGIRHAMRVASGLDSMMLGEPQILGQMKQAWQEACGAGTAKTHLRQVFEYIFGASKRVRNLSGIGSNPVSVAYAAVNLVGQLFKNYELLNVFLIGSGETATLVAKYLHKAGVKNFLVAGRSRESAEKLAMQFSGEALSITELPQHLGRADIVISATACPLPFISKDLIQQVLEDKPKKDLFLLDLAVPRDIEPNVAELQNIHLYNLDDLQTMSDEGMNQRRQAALKAEELVESELENYILHHRGRRASGAISGYRQRMEQLAEQELKRASERMALGVDHEQVLRELSTRLLNKLSHQPTTGLKQAAIEGREDLLDLVDYLFTSSKDSVLL